MAAKQKYERSDEAELVFAGFIAFADPILPDAAAVIGRLKDDGVAVNHQAASLVSHFSCPSAGPSWP